MKLGLKQKAEKTSTLDNLRDKLSSGVEAESGGAIGSWMTKGTKKIAAFVESIKRDSARNRKPEFYVIPDTTKRIRFRTSDPLASFQVYSFRVGGKWQTYTAPSEGERDMFQENGLRPQFKVAYEIVDLDGYTPKKGKNAGVQVKNVPSFWVLGMKLYEQVSILRQKYGDLTKRTFSVTRSGAGTGTVYTILPEDPKDLPHLMKIPSIISKFEECYRPPSLNEQARILHGYNPAEQEDDGPQAKRQFRQKE